MAADLETVVLKAINDEEEILDSGDFVKKIGADHLHLVGIMKSLQASEMVSVLVGGNENGRFSYNWGTVKCYRCCCRLDPAFGVVSTADLLQNKPMPRQTNNLNRILTISSGP